MEYIIKTWEVEIFMTNKIKSQNSASVIYYSVGISERPSNKYFLEMYGSLISIDCSLFRQSPSVSIEFIFIGRSDIADATFYYTSPLAKRKGDGNAVIV